jgi:2-polyprenyl-6-methoxyphenol hydroxylase-like FAD-dependent oxidoreductase
MGDCAHVMHPLAGQGLNTGLNDVRIMADVLQNAVSVGQDLGSDIVLRRYERQSKRHADVSC